MESVLAQEFPREQREILVVDDGSTDDTSERLKNTAIQFAIFENQTADKLPRLISVLRKRAAKLSPRWMRTICGCHKNFGACARLL